MTNKDKSLNRENKILEAKCKAFPKDNKVPNLTKFNAALKNTQTLLNDTLKDCNALVRKHGKLIDLNWSFNDLPSCKPSLLVGETELLKKRIVLMKDIIRIKKEIIKLREDRVKIYEDRVKIWKDGVEIWEDHRELKLRKWEARLENK